MIFVTVGTHEPFDRLVSCVDDWCRARGARAPEVFGQISARARYRPRHFSFVPVLEPDEYSRCFRESEFIVSHAGMGSIITALSLGKPIAILPRRGSLRETRNDHQFATMQRLRAHPGVFAAPDEAALPSVLDQLAAGTATASQKISSFAEDELIRALRRFIHHGDRK